MTARLRFIYKSRGKIKTMKLVKLYLSSLLYCAICLANAGSTSKCWQLPDIKCHQDFQLSGWFSQPVSYSSRVIRQCIMMKTCVNSTSSYFSSKEECEDNCALKCPEYTPNPPYAPNTVVISKELQGVDGLTYFSISTCGKGFILIGSVERRCNASGKWTGEKPICYEIIITVSIKKYNQDVCKYELNSNLLMVVEGEGVMITCTVKNTTSIDNIGMVWRKVKGQATHKLPPIHDLREDKDLEKNLISVTIDRASSVHSGSFSCMSDTIPKLSRNVTLQLKDPKKAPKIISYNVKIIENTMIILLHCFVRGNPAPEVHWYVNNLLVKGENKTISTFENTLLDITIRNPNCTHIGNYTCRAANAHGIIEHVVKSVTAEDLAIELLDAGSEDECKDSCLLCTHGIPSIVNICNMSDTVIIAHLIVNETSINNNVFVINESRVVKGSNSSHLTTVKLTEKASECDCITLNSQTWYVFTGTTNEDMLIINENDVVYEAPDHYQENLEKHCQ